LQNTSEIDAATWCLFHQHVYERLYCTKDKKQLVFENKFHHAFLYENCDGYALWKSHLVVLVAICKSQLAVCKKALKKTRVKISMKMAPGGKNWQLIYPHLKRHQFLVKSCI
jgi:hypothetical protein